MIISILGVLTFFLSFASVLFNDTVCCQYFIASVINKLLSMENWWNSTYRGKTKYSGKNQSQLLLVHGTNLMDWPGIETGCPLREIGN
jgi:hypothetical protein